jgi:hypothetical protein
MNPKRLLFALAVGLSAFAIGCGDDDDGGSSDSDAPAISKADFIEQGNAICEKGTQALNEAVAAIGQSPTQDDLENFVSDTMTPNIQGQIDDIRALGYPEGDEDELEGILSDSEDALNSIKDDPSVLTEGDDPFADTNKALNDYGLTACGT